MQLQQQHLQLQHLQLQQQQLQHLQQQKHHRHQLQQYQQQLRHNKAPTTVACGTRRSTALAQTVASRGMVGLEACIASTIWASTVRLHRGGGRSTFANMGRRLRERAATRART